MGCAPTKAKNSVCASASAELSVLPLHPSSAKAEPMPPSDTDDTTPARPLPRRRSSASLPVDGVHRREEEATIDGDQWGQPRVAVVAGRAVSTPAAPAVPPALPNSHSKQEAGRVSRPPPQFVPSQADRWTPVGSLCLGYKPQTPEGSALGLLDSMPGVDSLDRRSSRSMAGLRADDGDYSIPESCIVLDRISSRRGSYVLPGDEIDEEELRRNMEWLELHSRGRLSPGFLVAEPADPRWWEPLLAPRPRTSD